MQQSNAVDQHDADFAQCQGMAVMSRVEILCLYVHSCNGSMLQVYLQPLVGFVDSTLSAHFSGYL